jgi:hypothetical protein
LHSISLWRGYVARIWVPKIASMEADLGISRWAIAALVAAMILVGAVGLVLRGGATQDQAPVHTSPVNASAQSH